MYSPTNPFSPEYRLTQEKTRHARTRAQRDEALDLADEILDWYCSENSAAGRKFSIDEVASWRRKIRKLGRGRR